MKEKPENLGQIIVELLEACARVEEGELSFEYSPQGSVVNIRNSAGLPMSYYSGLVDEIVALNQPSLPQAIDIARSLLDYCLIHPVRAYKRWKCAFVELARMGERL